MGETDAGWVDGWGGDQSQLPTGARGGKVRMKTKWKAGESWGGGGVWEGWVKTCDAVKDGVQGRQVCS